MTKSTKREEAQKHVTAWRKSGLRQLAYCRQNDLYDNYISNWSSRLAKRKSKPVTSFIEVSSKAPQNLISLKLDLDSGFRFAGQLQLDLSWLFKR